MNALFFSRCTLNICWTWKPNKFQVLTVEWDLELWRLISCHFAGYCLLLLAWPLFSVLMYAISFTPICALIAPLLHTSVATMDKVLPSRIKHTGRVMRSRAPPSGGAPMPLGLPFTLATPMPACNN